MVALDRIEGVGGRQHLERPAHADLAGDADLSSSDYDEEAALLLKEHTLAFLNRVG
jgi:hypothetical protein